ncbi:MAG: S8 family serine peptidase [Planctomycetes bacterium]|nr:S8 family serine peptidase [Planctomycetota bacterium]MBL7041864.1 S8 family serine peptidase [Pirellulaceae bacterium]
MRGDDEIRAVQHRTDYETFEQRLVLSTQPWGDLVLDPLAVDASQAQHSTPTPTANPARELTEDLAYIKQRYGLQGEGQTVAIIDSGIAYEHVALGGGFGSEYRVVGGWDFTEENDADPHDDGPAGFHGTHVAGVIGSDDIEHPGIATAVDLVALRVFNDQGQGRFDWLEDALQWVHEKRDSFEYPITTINLSLGVNLEADDTEPWEMLEDEFAQLKTDGIFVAVAAGNSFEDTSAGTLTYPASSQYVVPVASVDSDGVLSDFSQRDANILAAPGERVTSTVPGHLFGDVNATNEFAYAHGTSMATPYVAGGSVLVREAMQQAGYEEITQDTIEGVLRETADTIHDDATGQTFLSLNLRRAVDSLFSEAVVEAEGQDGSVSQTGTTVQVEGTGEDDVFEFYAGSPHRIVFNGVEHQFDASTIESIAFSGGDGSDQVILVSDGGDDTVLIRPTSVELTGQNIEVRGDAVEAIVVEGNGGFDRATMYDSAGDDTLRAYEDRVEFTGAEFRQEAKGFDRVYVYAEEGGSDRAHLYDSAGNDRFYGRPSYASLSGTAFNNRVEGFDRVYSYAEAGGQDTAYFYDSSGNDRFYARPQHSTMSGMGYYNQSAGFDRVYAYATLGGSDEAYLYDTPGNDYFHGRATEASISGTNRYANVRGFDRVSAYADSGGIDRAYFHDSGGNDRFNGRPTYASMSGVGYYSYARGFDQVKAYASAGHDTAYVYGSSRDDALDSTSQTTKLVGARFAITAQNFEIVQARGGGGADEAVFREVGQSDSFYGTEDHGVLDDSDTERSFYDFDEVTLEGHSIEADISALEYVFRQVGQ